MSDNLESDIEVSLGHEERAVVALEQIADALTMWAKIEAQRFEREYPEKREPRDATVTRIPTAEDKLKANLHGTEKTLEEWITAPGTFERKFEKSQISDKTKKTGVSKKTSGKPRTS